MREHVYDSKMASSFALVHPIYPTSLKARLTMMSNNNLWVLDQSCFAIVDVVPSGPSVARVTQGLFSQSTRSFGRHPLCLSISPPTSFLRCATKDWLMPIKATTLRV